MTDTPAKNFIDLTANIVSAYVSNNPTPASELPALINQIHAALQRVSTGRPETTGAGVSWTAALTSGVSVSSSTTSGDCSGALTGSPG